MYSRPIEFPTSRLYLKNEATDELVDTTLIVPRPSKLTFLYQHYDKHDKSFQNYLEKIAFNKDFLKTDKIILFKETISGFHPLCEPVEKSVVRAACLDKGNACE